MTSQPNYRIVFFVRLAESGRALQSSITSHSLVDSFTWTASARSLSCWQQMSTVMIIPRGSSSQYSTHSLFHQMLNVTFCGCAQVFVRGVVLFVRAQPFLSFPNVGIKTQFPVTSNGTGQELLMLFTSQSITSKQRCTYGHSLIFVVLAQSMRYPYTRFFNFAHLMNMSHDGGIVTVHHICQFSSTLTWIIVD